MAVPKTEISRLKRAVKKEKKADAPLLAVTFLPNMTQPLASAKSAIDQMKKNTITVADKI